MPFVTDDTEYSWDYDRAAQHSDLVWGFKQLLRQAEDPTFHRRVIEWMVAIEPRLKFIVPTNEVLVNAGYQRHRRWLKRALDPESFELLFPEGKGYAHAEFGAPKHDFEVEQLARPPRGGQLLGAKVKEYFRQPLLQKAYEFSPKRLQGQGDLLTVAFNAWLPASMHPEQIYASEYMQACQDLSVTPAGKKARELLLSNLTETQREDYWKKGYFITTGSLYDPKEPHLYVIERGFPNGNILKVKPERSRGGNVHLYPKKTYCFHAKDPHPMDDILLAQKFIVETDEKDFLKEANESDARYPNYPLQHSLRAR